MSKRLIASLLLGMLMFVACGGDKGTTEPDAAPSRGECTPAPAAGNVPNLPQGFPLPGEVTLTGSTKAGPSTIITGYFQASLEEAFPEYKDAFDQAGWDVTKDEKDANDAEVGFAHGNINGEVAMFGECTERTQLKITIRPS